LMIFSEATLFDSEATLRHRFLRMASILTLYRQAIAIAASLSGLNFCKLGPTMKLPFLSISWIFCRGIAIRPTNSNHPLVEDEIGALP
jgi:hypothetical protein